MKIFKLLADTIYWLAITVLVLIAGTTAFSVLKAPGGWRSFVVLSGSMEPKIKTGSVVVIKPQAEYKQGDVVTFLSSPKANLKKLDATITHRIAEVHDDEGRATFTTKGDANEDPDRESVTERQVLGKVMVSIPFLGYAVSFAKTQTGFITLIIIPGTLIIYSELVNIKKELVELAKTLKEKIEKKKEAKKEVEKPKKKITKQVKGKKQK